MPITHTCRISGKEFTITDQEIALLEKLTPVIGGEKIALPFPTLCPEERRRRRLQFKNYLTLFKRKDSLEGKDIISIYPPDSPYTVYSQPYWWSDNWDPKSYGRAYDPSVPIAEQIHQIRLSTPLPALDNAYTLQENSEYINGNGPSKNCYLISNGVNNENCLYGWFTLNCKNLINVNYAQLSENCSFSTYLSKSYNIHFSWDVTECRDSQYIFSCEGSQYLLGCVGLKNQKYHILNTPVSQDEWENTQKKLANDHEFRKKFELRVIELTQAIDLHEPILLGSVNCTGDFCYHSKNCFDCYHVGSCMDAMYITSSHEVKDSIGLDQWGDRASLIYECTDTGKDASNIYWSNSVWSGSRYNFYSTKCMACTYIFGCSGLRNQSYCIFNKQYSKEEWEKTVKEIIRQMQREGTWGEYLDPKYAFFAYDESHAEEQMPLTKEEAISRGLRWADRPETPPEGITRIIPGEKLPDDISKIPDDVLHWAIKCMKTGKLYKIQPLELDMHRKFGIPLPKLHPLERIHKLFSWDDREFDFEF